MQNLFNGVTSHMFPVLEQIVNELIANSIHPEVTQREIVRNVANASRI